MKMNWKTPSALACIIVLSVSAAAAQGTSGGPSASMVLTLEPKHGKQLPPLETADIEVTQGKEKLPIASWQSLKGSKLQLLVLIDNSSQSTFDAQINDMKKWINDLPSTTEVGIAYMQNGMASVAHDFTSDHTAAANSIHLTMGIAGADVSPYDSLSDAIKKWPAADGARREVLMISSGIEGLGGGMAPENPYVNKSIEDAQKAGVVVYAIFNPASGHMGHNFWRVNYGQNFLSQLSDETGGEAYITTFSAPVSFVPFLEDLSTKFDSQYLLTFNAKPATKTELVPVRVKIKEKDADVAAANRVLVKASL